MSIATDRPIWRREDDELERGPLADALADQVASAPRGDGFVVGIGGRWGSGKTSLLNLVVESAKGRDPDLVTLAFNPWLFAGADELVLRFCAELASQLKHQANAQVRGIGDRLADYGGALSPLGKVPVLGKGVAVAELALAVADAKGRLPDRSARGRYEQLRQALADLDRRVLVTVDDVDRLTDDEVRELVRVVKVVGDLPNVIYLLAYDRERIEAALGEGADPRAHGRLFLEKVVQVTHDIPPASRLTLSRMFTNGLNAILSATARCDHGHWKDIYATLLVRYVRTVRDVRRLLNALPVTFTLLADELAVEDIVALEALRVFDHAVWEALPAAAPALTEFELMPELDDHDARRKQLEMFITPSVAGRDAMLGMLKLLFPGGHAELTERDHQNRSERLHQAIPAWRRLGRVALAENLRVYLDLVLPERRVPALTVKAVLVALNAGRPINGLTANLSTAQLDDLLVALHDRNSHFEPHHAADAAIALFALAPRLESRIGDTLDLGSEFQLTRVVGAWFERIDGADARREAVITAFDAVALSARFQIIRYFGHGSVNGPGWGLIDEDSTQELKARLAQDVMTQSPAQLVKEWRVRNLVDVILAAGNGQAHLRELVADDAFLTAVISAQVRRSQADVVLPWRWLVSIVGDDLTERVIALTAGLEDGRSDRNAIALRLAKRYAEGDPLPDPSPGGQTDDEVD